MDNIKQVVKDVRFLIATDCCNETIQARIENFINEREQALRQPTVISSFCQCEKPDWCMESNDCGECGKEIQTKRQNDL